MGCEDEERALGLKLCSSLFKVRALTNSIWPLTRTMTEPPPDDDFFDFSLDPDPDDPDLLSEMVDEVEGEISFDLRLLPATGLPEVDD